MNPIEKNLMKKKLSIGKIEHFLFFLLMFFLNFNMLANDEDAKRRILDVKLNEEFIFGEGLNEDKEIAYGNALSDLLLYSNELKKDKNQQEVSLCDLQLNVETLDYFDGKRYEVIVYIPLNILYQIQSKSPKEDLSLTDMKSNPDKTPSINNSAFYYPEKGNDIEDFLLTQDNFTEIRDYLSVMKRSGRILETGAIDNTSSLPKNASLILIDDLGGILSILSPRNENGRLNYRTRLFDDVNNYSDCKFIVWYTK